MTPARKPQKTPRFSVNGELPQEELADLVASCPLPDDFEFGVATAGFQNEGGFNGADEPKNNWADWEASGRVQTSGLAVRFWDHPEEHISRAASIGLNAFRLSIEWARIFPCTKPALSKPPDPDKEALRRYVSLLKSLRVKAMEPFVTITHFTHPRWLGVDGWSRDSTIQRYLEFVSYAIEGINSELVGTGESPISRILTFNEPNAPGPAGYFIGMFPPGRRGRLREAYDVTDRMMAAHIKAYNLIHDVYESKGWKTPQVSTNIFFSWTWGLGQCLIDLLLARESGVALEPSDLAAYVRDCSARFYRAWQADPNRPTGARVLLEQILSAVTARLVPERFSRTMRALYEAKRESCLDFIALDYYDPYLSNGLARPGRSTAMKQHWSPVANFWEQKFNPTGLPIACAACAQNAPLKPVIVAENGMATAVDEGMAYPRPDRITRDLFIRRYLAQIYVTRASGIDLRGYYHWTLIDNYEWGSYTPRFGIYGVDRTGTTPKILETDALGIDAAGAFRDAIVAIKTADPRDIAAELLR